jgi:hypothetical protein
VEFGISTASVFGGFGQAQEIAGSSTSGTVLCVQLEVGAFQMPGVCILPGRK